MTIAPALLTALFIYLKQYIDFSNIVSLILYAIVFVALYIPLAWFFVLNKSEKELFSSPVRAAISRIKH